MLTIPSVEAQNSFGALLDKAQRQMISVTRRRALLLWSCPQVLHDYIDAQLALQAEVEGFATEVEVGNFLATLRNA